MIDDLFYSGAGMNMAHGGDFSNPYITRYFPNDHFFFFYPPVYSYVLAGWLKLFGLSAMSATGYQVVTYLLMSLAVMAVIRRNCASGWLYWFVPLAVTGGFLADGLRTEPTAVAMAWCGFALIECGARRAAPLFIACLLLFLAGTTAPRNALYDAALILVAAWRLWSEAQSNKSAQLRFLAVAAAAASCAVFIFLLMIHFRVREFWTCFHTHSQIVKFKRANFLSLAHKGFLAAFVVLSIIAWRFRSDRLVQICLALGAATSVAVITHTIGYGPGGFHVMLMALFIGIIASARLPRFAVLFQGAVCAILVVRNVPDAALALGELTGKISRDRGPEYGTVRTMTSTSEHQLFMDVFVARYIFDYRPPEGTVDFAFAAPFPYVGTVMPHLLATSKPGDTYLLNPRFRAYVERSTYLSHEPHEQWKFLLWSFDKDPRRVFIVHPDECKGLKSATERPF